MMKCNSNRVMILGTRGSIPVSGKNKTEYGGATTCMMVQLAGQYILLDAGTGLAALPEEVLCEEELSLLLSHAHNDHLMGLSFCPYLLRHGNVMTIYSSCADKTKAAVERLFSPPLWPIELKELPGGIKFASATERFKLGAVSVETMSGEHPGGVTIYKLCGDGKTIVFATDISLNDDLFTELAAFAKDCDLLMIDGQYSEDEWAGRKNFGHSRWTEAARFGGVAGVKQTRIIHHDPSHSDQYLDAAENEIRAIYPKCSFAREGEEILL